MASSSLGWIKEEGFESLFGKVDLASWTSFFDCSFVLEDCPFFFEIFGFFFSTSPSINPWSLRSCKLHDTSSIFPYESEECFMGWSSEDSMGFIGEVTGIPVGVLTLVSTSLLLPDLVVLFEIWIEHPCILKEHLNPDYPPPIVTISSLLPLPVQLFFLLTKVSQLLHSLLAHFFLRDFPLLKPFGYLIFWDAPSINHD